MKRHCPVDWASVSVSVRGVFVEPIYDVAYQLGLAWADDFLRVWSDLRLPVPEDWPFSKGEAALAVLRLPPESDPVVARRLAAIANAAARARSKRVNARTGTKTGARLGLHSEACFRSSSRCHRHTSRFHGFRSIDL
jgi:hypothetical protein